MTLRAEGLRFAFRPGRPVLAGVDVELAGGVVTAIVGPNGAGKSTLLRALGGVLAGGRGSERSGRVTLDGRPVETYTATERAARVAYISQRASLAFPFSVRQVVRLGRYAAGAEPGAHDRAVREALDRVGLAQRADEAFGTLSVGQQQLATLARALAQLDTAGASGGAGRVLLADEPVSSMDPRHALLALGILREQASRGVAVGVVLHDLSLAARSADRALVLDGGGRVASNGPVGEALTPAVLSAVFRVRFGGMPRPGENGGGAPASLVAIEPIDDTM